MYKVLVECSVDRNILLCPRILSYNLFDRSSAFESLQHHTKTVTIQMRIISLSKLGLGNVPRAGLKDLIKDPNNILASKRGTMACKYVIKACFHPLNSIYRTCNL